VLLWVLAPLAGAPPAWGQSGGGGGCGGGTGLETAEVTIDTPAPNAIVSGKNVTVRGSAQATLGQLSRVEITLAGISKVRTSSPSSSIDFEASFDVSNVPPGETSLQVVACGAFNLAGTLARGEAEIRVRVQASASSTTTTLATATSVARGASPAPLAGGPTTSVAVTTTKAGQTTTTSTPVTSVPQQDASPVTTRAEPVRPRATEAPLVLTEAPDDDSSGPPLWVGAAVGLSGGLGLLFSASSSWRRRRVPAPLEPLEPADADLVDVR
jgi:hypothetical protein